MFKRSPSPTPAPQADLSHLTWETSIVDLQRRSTRVAWRVAVGCLTIALLSVTALALVLPLKTTEVRVVSVDKLTGETGVAKPLADYAVTPNELNDKYWSKRFLMARERYSYKILQSDYDTVRLLAGALPWRAYSQLFEGPESLEKKYGPDIEMIPTVLSSTISQYGIATIRYELKERDLRSTDGSTKVERRIATLRYHYAPNAKASERDLIDNPLGFSVDAYQTVLEVATVTTPSAEPTAITPQAAPGGTQAGAKARP